MSKDSTRDARESPALKTAGRYESIWVIVILCLTFFTYVKTLSNDFTYDDSLYAAAYIPSGPTMVAGAARGLHEEPHDADRSRPSVRGTEQAHPRPE